MTKESPMQVFRDIRRLLQLYTPKEILTIDDLILYTGFSREWIYKQTSNKLIPHHKPNGKTVFFKKSEIDEWLLSKPVKPRKSLEQIEFEIRTQSKNYLNQKSSSIKSKQNGKNV